MSRLSRLVSLPIFPLAAALAMPLAAPSTAVSASPGGGDPVPFPIPLSAAGPDQLMTAAPGPNGGFYVAGFLAQAPQANRQVVVLRLTATGAIDSSFGTGGVALVGLTFAGGLDEIDVVVQNGKPVVSATIPSATIPNDRDIAIARLNTNGTLDNSFGVGGVRIINLNNAIDTGSGSLTGLDSSRALALAADGAIYVHALQRANGVTIGGNPRTDTDFTIVKLTANGAIDTLWGDGGKVMLDIEESNATGRGMVALDDGSVIGAGYASTPSLGSVQPVVYKTTPWGTLDAGFANGGVFHEPVLALQTEIYGVVPHGNNLVTGGYGRDTGAVNEMVSMRFSALTGQRDLAWGGTPNGVVMFDASGAGLTNNVRGALGLPGGGTALFGSVGPNGQSAQDAALAILSGNGQLDHANGGIQLFVFGNDGADAFWGAAFNDGQMLLVGYKGAGVSQTVALNDDAYALLIPITDDVIFRNGFDLL